ncbi:Hypothetical predicted protein, partial [Scomber scombrus]
HRSTKCAYDITQTDSEQPKHEAPRPKNPVKEMSLEPVDNVTSVNDNSGKEVIFEPVDKVNSWDLDEAPRAIHLMELDELEEMILRSYEEKNPVTEMSLEPVDKVTSVKDNSGKEVIFEPVDKVNSWDLDEAPRPIHLMEFDELEEMILRSYEEKNPVTEMSLEPVDKVTSVKDNSGKEVIFEPVDEVNSWDLDEAPRAIHLMDFDELEEMILRSYEEKNPVTEMSLEPVDKVTSVKDNSGKEVIFEPVDEVNSWDLDEAPRAIHLMDFDELEEMILRSYEEKNPVKEMSLEPVEESLAAGLHSQDPSSADLHSQVSSAVRTGSLSK